MEAVTAHTAGAGPDGSKAAASTISNRHKASTVSEPKSKADKSVTGTKAAAAAAAAAAQSSGESQVSSVIFVYYQSLVNYSTMFLFFPHSYRMLPLAGIWRRAETSCGQHTARTAQAA